MKKRKRRLDDDTPIGKFTKSEISSMESRISGVMEANGFENLLTSYSKKFYKHEMSCSFPKQFMKDFIGLPDIVKENVMAHVKAINRSQTPRLFGKCYVFQFGIHNDKKPFKDPANGRLMNNWPYYVANMGKGYRMIFEYRPEFRLIRYICVKNSTNIDKTTLKFPDLDDWEKVGAERILERISTERNSLDKNGFATYAAFYNYDKFMGDL